MRAEFENPRFQHENRLPARSVMLPAQVTGVDYRTKENSDRVQSLCGTWKFLFIEDDFDYIDGTAAVGDFDGWDDIPVPSEWQFYGYGRLRYPNVDYSFPLNPPYVGLDNPLGIYRRKFVLSSQAKDRLVTLHFDGVDGAFNLYINGAYVGFSKGSRMAAEFDITDFVHPGENDITVEIWTYSDAQYLENQDMWNANGIFRDVYLLFENRAGLWDWEMITTSSSLAVVLMPRTEGTDLRAELTFDRRTRKCDLAHENSVKFELPSPESWNAENPYLYDLELKLYSGETLVEIHSKKVGLCESAVIDGLFCVNGTPIVFCGANRHETGPECGRAITVAQIERELKLLKSCNFNAIRTSHYPQHPAFYEICAELGIYVLDEADIESHGCGAAWDQGLIAKRAEWEEAFLDRTRRMYMRDKNETCIVVWSIGNEAGEGPNIERCVEWLRTQRVKKPLLQAQDNGLHPYMGDFRQWGYANLATVREYAEMESDYPAIGTEYGHGMGNSPGGLEDIWDIIDETPQMQGGFIWEFKSHGAAVDPARAGDKRGVGAQDVIHRDPGQVGMRSYFYGGDYGEGPSWGNFLLDGYCFSDGTPKPALYEIKHLMAPLRIRNRDGALSIYCRNSFERLDNVTMIWNLCEDTKVLSSGTKTGLCFGPGDVVRVPYPAELPDERKAGAQYLLNVMMFLGERDLGYAQIVLAREDAKLYEASAAAAVTVQDVTRRKLTAQAGASTLTFIDGMLARMERGGEVLLDRKMQISLYRVNTDNDGTMVAGLHGRHWRDVWDRAHLDKPVFQPEAHTVTSEGDVTVLTFVGKIVFEGLFEGFLTTVTYRLYADGTVGVCVEGEPYGFLPETLPRIGVRFETPKTFDAVQWYGRGWQENYPDRKACTLIGKYEGDAASMSVHYERPQDNGVRVDTRWIGLTDGGKGGLLFSACDEFAFAVHDYSILALRDAEHRCELNKDPLYNHLYLDYAVRGLGSNSCGPEPEEQYELRPHAFRFAFAVSPWCGEDDALRHARSVFGMHSERLSDTFKFDMAQDRVRQNFDCRPE